MKSLFLSLLLLSLIQTQSHAVLVLNEILADPPTGAAGDANQDGVRSSSDDEFVELVNLSGDPVDLSGYSLTDASAKRHLFSAGSQIGAYEFLVVFGGGSPSLPGINWQTASTGSLSLNNSGDTLSLFDPGLNLIFSVAYGDIAGGDQSIVLSPEAEGSDFILHSEAPGAGGALFSPGTLVNGGQLARQEEPGDELPMPTPTIPEPLSLVTMSLGLAGLRLRDN